MRNWPRFLWHSHSWLCAASHHPSRTKARQSQTVPLESSPQDLPAKRTRTGKNACATLEPTSHDLLPPQPSSLASRRQIHLYHLEAVRLFARLRAQENPHSYECPRFRSPLISHGVDPCSPPPRRPARALEVVQRRQPLL